MDISALFFEGHLYTQEEVGAVKFQCYPSPKESHFPSPVPKTAVSYSAFARTTTSFTKAKDEKLNVFEGIPDEVFYHMLKCCKHKFYYSI